MKRADRSTVRAMNRATPVLAACIFGCVAVSVRGGSHYVSLSGTNDAANGYNTWAGAATRIQSAVDVAVNGDTIRVTNGTYVLDATILVDKAITVESVNGREVTIIKGPGETGDFGCVRLDHGDAVLDGFTIRDGYDTTWDLYATVGGVYIDQGTVRNCLIVNNHGNYAGGVSGPNAATTTRRLHNSVVQSNTGKYVGGVSFFTDSQVSNCIITANESTGTTEAKPAGCYFVSTQVYDSEISDNAGAGGGGVYASYSTQLKRCRIIRNSGVSFGGAMVLSKPTGGSTFRNCLIYGNRSTDNTAGLCIDAAGAVSPVFQNCTIVSNATAASDKAGGIEFMGTNAVYLCNTIAYHNTAAGAYSNILNSGASSAVVIRNCCFGMAADDLAPSTNLTGMVPSNPLMIDWTTGNCRLSQQSRCLDAGLDEDWMAGALDLDGQPRISGKAVDLGAYERQAVGTIVLVR